jgi:hypothetical protein
VVVMRGLFTALVGRGVRTAWKQQPRVAWGSTRAGRAAAAAAIASIIAASATQSSVICKEDDGPPTVSLDELIGPLPNVQCTTGTIMVKGLAVKWWKYESTEQDKMGRPPVVALHGGPSF